MQPITYFREPCVLIREGQGEASVAVRVAGAIEHRNIYCLGCRDRPDGRRLYACRRYGETANGPTVSKNSWTHVRTLPGPGIAPFDPVVVQGRLGKAEDAEA